MKFEITIPDQVTEEEPEMLKFLDALQLLVNRMAVSHFKYGNMSDKYPDSAHAIDSVYKRLSMYGKSGNTEDCLDAANFCIIEYVLPSHEKAHFRAQSAKESPGIVYHEG
jgi:hypothetical protein